MSQRDELDRMMDKLAQSEVGRTGSELIFVSTKGVVRAVFTRKSSLHAAIEYARSLGESRAVIVEDATGIAWENRFSEREQDRLAREEEGD